MRVLVTGATSMIGRGVAQRLTAAGHHVETLQRNTSGLPNREWLGSITDEEHVTAAVQDVDSIVHLAAKVGVAGRWEEYEAVNRHGTQLLLDAGRRAGVKRFVQISSPSVAHAGHSLIAADAAPADPAGARGHYARSKAMAERYALSQAGADLAVVAIRPHLVWGPGDPQLVGRIVERARAGRLATIGSGAALIDTTYVDNAVDAIVATHERSPRLNGRAIVVSNGQPRPVHELLTRIVAAAGLPEPTMRVPATLAIAGGGVAEWVWNRANWQNDPPMTSFLAEQLSTAHWFDQREARAALDWKPAVTLEEGFQRLAAWFADQNAAG